MSPDEFISIYPNLFHMAEFGSWPSIQRHGLLSAAALVDLFELPSDRRSRLLSERRSEKIPIAHATYGIAVLRDQKPMNDSTLRDCLQDNLTPSEWYEILNFKVFFWVTQERLHRLLSAKPYRGDRHDVLTIDTKSLIANYLDKITLSHINSGTSIPWKHSRGRETFKSIDAFPFQARRNSPDPVVELTVAYSVPDIERFVLSVDVMQSAEIVGSVYRRS